MTYSSGGSVNLKGAVIPSFTVAKLIEVLSFAIIEVVECNRSNRIVRNRINRNSQNNRTLFIIELIELIELRGHSHIDFSHASRRSDVIGWVG